MKTPFKFHPRRGFTLIELLTVIAIVGILAAIIIPTVGRVRESAKRAKCMSNVRQISVSLVNYAASNKGQKFPLNAGSWAWDVEVNLARTLSNQAGRELFYCPSSNMLTLYQMDDLFPYKGNPAYAVTGYVLLIPGTGQVEGRYLNDRIKAEYVLDFGLLKVSQPASRRALVVDAVISNDKKFTEVVGGLKDNLSNHMLGDQPQGGHTGYVDGSVKWRPFKDGVPTNPNDFSSRTTGTISFWF